jgi:hypothetical protein
VTAGTLAYVHHDRQLETHGSTSGEEESRAALPATPTTAAPASAAPTTAIELGPDMAPGTSPVSRSKTSPTGATRSTLDDEVAMVAEARQAEAQGDPGRALLLLDAYDQRFPSGSLQRESTTLRIEALVEQGNRSAAEKIAARFLASHPSSLDARNIHRALDPEHDPGRH